MRHEDTISFENKKRLSEMAQKYSHSFTEKDLKFLKQIGQGEDGFVYKINNELALKLYKSKEIKDSTILDDDYVKVQKPKQFVNKPSFQARCIDENGVRLSYEEIIYYAMRKQKDIEKTFLPLCPFYINDHFKGCIIKYFKNCIPISSYQILDKIQELLNHNCYPTDLYNKIKEKRPHNNIIVQISKEGMKPQIIDLDGRSVCYTAFKNQSYYNETLFSFTTFLLELFYNQNLEDYYEEDDTYRDYYLDYFETKMPKEIAKELLSPAPCIEGIHDFLDYKKRSLKK